MSFFCSAIISSLESLVVQVITSGLLAYWWINCFLSRRCALYVGKGFWTGRKLYLCTNVLFNFPSSIWFLISGIFKPYICHLLANLLSLVENWAFIDKLKGCVSLCDMWYQSFPAYSSKYMCVFWFTFCHLWQIWWTYGLYPVLKCQNICCFICIWCL